MPYARHENPDEHIRVQPLVFAGGAVMAFIAGYVNACMLDVFHVPVSHMSGAVSHLGIDLGERKFAETSLIFQIVLFFVLGAIASGFIVGSKKLKPGRRYAVVMIVEAAILGLAAHLVSTGDKLCVPLAAMACGMQNAMASSYFGLIVRTTHVTGILTDIGVLIGNALRHREFKAWKLGFLLCLVLGFFLGALVSVWLKPVLGVHALWAAAGLCGCVAVTYLALLKKLIQGHPGLETKMERKTEHV
jgi:uncharacterized membrane protein YoaK (UPF0700 family)